MPQNLGFDIELRFPFNDAMGRVKDALKQEGFGILTEIDLQAAFREKLGREFLAVGTAHAHQTTRSLGVFVIGAADTAGSEQSRKRSHGRVTRLLGACRAGVQS